MNAPARIVANAPGYDSDGFGWAMHQADLLKAKRFGEVDWDNVIEEIESVGRSEQSSATSALRVLLLHILKWNYQPDRRGRSWMLSIIEQRLAFEQVMAKNPGLKSYRSEMLGDAYRRARLEAARETELKLDTFPVEPPGWPDILEQDYRSRRALSLTDEQLDRYAQQMVLAEVGSLDDTARGDRGFGSTGQR